MLEHVENIEIGGARYKNPFIQRPSFWDVADERWRKMNIESLWDGLIFEEIILMSASLTFMETI